MVYKICIYHIYINMIRKLYKKKVCVKKFRYNKIDKNVI